MVLRKIILKVVFMHNVVRTMVDQSNLGGRIGDDEQ